MLCCDSPVGIQSPASLPSIAAAASSRAATDPPMLYASDSMAPAAASALIRAPISAASRLTPSPLKTTPAPVGGVLMVRDLPRQG